jgi:hypothetical protein
MSKSGSNTWEMLKLLRRGGPALCNVAVTNSCNAICDFELLHSALGSVLGPDNSKFLVLSVRVLAGQDGLAIVGRAFELKSQISFGP